MTTQQGTGFAAARTGQIRMALSAATLSLLIALITIRAGAQTYDAAANFSSTSNPNGVWSYGWSQSRGSAFDLDLQVDYPAAGLPAWISNCCGTIEPDVFHNETDAPISPAGTNLIPAKSLGFHPGPGGQNAVVRWTTPTNGNYTVQATIQGYDFVGPTTTDVAVLHNGLTLYASNVDGYGPSRAQSYSRRGDGDGRGDTHRIHGGILGTLLIISMTRRGCRR